MLDSRPLTALTKLPRIFSFLRAICLSCTLTASCPERNQDIGSISCTTIVNSIMKKYILALFVYSRIIRGLGLEFHYSSAVQFEFPGSRLAKRRLPITYTQVEQAESFSLSGHSYELQTVHCLALPMHVSSADRESAGFRL